MKVSKLLLATNNAKKVEEIRNLLPHSFDLLTLKDVNFIQEIPETTGTIPGNSMQKAKFVFDRTGLNCLSDDSGLLVAALGGAPGVDSAHYAGLPPDNEKNIDLLLEKLKDVDDRRAKFITVLTLILDGEAYQFEGVLSGEINRGRKGLNGFGYDPVFIPDGESRTFAEMESSEKNAISHRANALKKLSQFIADKSLG
jgi:XTP/dITP diphosphohydrolase